MKTFNRILLAVLLALTAIPVCAQVDNYTPADVSSVQISEEDAAGAIRGLDSLTYRTKYLQLNPTLKDIYHELDSIFPLHNLANECPTDCGYWVNFDFRSDEDFKRYRPWLDTVLRRLAEVPAYTRKTILTDSADNYINGIEMTPVTNNYLQKDYCYLIFRSKKMSFYYSSKIGGNGFDFAGDASDPNSLPRQDIADEMDKLMNKYIKRKNVRVEEVTYDETKFNYAYLTFTNLQGGYSSGYRYIVPNCTAADYSKFHDAISKYSRTSPVRTSFNDNYWQYEASAICIFRPNGQKPLIIASALKGTDLYLVRVEGNNSTLLPRAWAEDNLKWELKDIHRVFERKPLAPPVK